jgi:perosamine synthetase
MSPNLSHIPVFSPATNTDDAGAVSAAILRGEVSGLGGEEVSQFESEFASFSECAFGVSTSSGSTALQLAIQALDFPKGSEVLVSASTNVASALAIFHNGCVTVPIDSERTSWNLNISLLEGALSDKTRGLLVVHLLGCPVDMDRVVEFCTRHKLKLIEDCAEAHGAQWRGRSVGSFGDLGCYSFYANKIITTGEGGMIVTNDEVLAARCRYLKNLANGVPRFLHLEAGHNFRLSALQAALGRSQLRRIKYLIQERQSVAEYYEARLQDLTWLTTQKTPTEGFNTRWAFGIVLHRPELRDPLTAHLREHGIDSRTQFCPMNLQPFLSQSPLFRHLPCPIAEQLWTSGLQLPSGYGLSENDLERVVAAVRGFSP